MSWSLQLGRIAGIPIYLHWTFLILLAWVGVGDYLENGDLEAAALGVASLLALFGCVVLHELGHALAARRFGIATSDITMLPIGGVARLRSMPDEPWQELVVAVAGPLVNVVIAALLYLAGVRPDVRPSDPAMLIHAAFWPRLLIVNVMLVVFNLIPAFPMDGGRVLRAVLAMTTDYARATRIAATVGQLLAIGFGFLGLTSGNFMLLLIALFVWIGAEGEARQVETRAALKGVSVGEAMLTDYRTLRPDDTLGHAAGLLLAGSQQDFPVLDGDRPAGVLTRQDLLRGLSQDGPASPVSAFASAGLEGVEEGSPLMPALARIREEGRACLQVLRDGRPVGLLTPENVGEFLMIRSALGADGSRPGASSSNV